MRERDTDLPNQHYSHHCRRHSMTDNKEQWTDAELSARCQAGERPAWDRLVKMLASIESEVVSLCRYRGWPASLELIHDAMQNVLCRLWQERTGMAEASRRYAGSLRELLLKRTCRAVENLLK